TPRASALWRQGNLLHFGFEQPPTKLNGTGRNMLINAIVYISHFTEDSPIDATPSVFGKDKISESRRRAKNSLKSHSRWATNEITAATIASFNALDDEKAKAWIDENGSWLHPGLDRLIEIDQEAKSLDIPFDSPEFFSKAIASLKNVKTKNTA